MPFQTFNITRGVIGPNATAESTAVSAILATGVAVAGKLVLGTVYSVTSLKQAEDTLGITAAYDTANALVLHRHIHDFYSWPKNAGVNLYILVAALTAAPADLLEDTGAIYAKKLITAGGGDIKQLALAFNVAADYTETRVDGLNSHIRAAIAKAQLLYTWALASEMPCQIILEGRGISDTASSMLDLRAIPSGLTVLDANKVSVCIHQDWDYADARTGFAQKYAAVGKLLGTVAAAQVNQSVAEVASFRLDDAKAGTFVTPGFSNHKQVEGGGWDADLETLTNKAYIFAGIYTAISGVYFNGDHTCTAIIVDADGNINEHQIYYGRTMDYATTELKRFLTPLIGSRVAVDTQTSLMPPAQAKAIEVVADENVFKKMATDGLCSGGKATVNVNSNVLPPVSRLDISFKLVPTAILNKINGTIYLTRNL
jgi:Protein of unknown function (DUF2586)